MIEHAMTQMRYSVAASLDGFIAGPNGEFDWIPMDPDIDFKAMYAGFSHLVMGRRSYEVYVATGGAPGPPLPVTVCSTSLPEGERDGVRFVHDAVAAVRALKASHEKAPIWLWGGGKLFGVMVAAGLVDGVDVAVVPILLGGGIPLFPPPAGQMPLHLVRHRVYEKSGIVALDYDVVRRG